MESKNNKAFLVSLVVIAAALVQSSTAQSTTHVVADSLGWIVPPAGASAYSTWAASQSFKVGDTLVFNFATGRHDVAQVTKAAFDGCNTASPISRVTNSPANIVLNSTGEHYYICTFPGHCAGGQKLAVNVSSGASSPAPQPSSPAPQPSTPTPTTAPTPTSTPPSPSPSPTTATPPPSTATPPSPSPSPTTATPPPSTATPPPSSATPPGPTTPSSPSPTGETGTPPAPGNSAKSLGVAFSSTFLAIFVAFLY